MGEAVRLRAADGHDLSGWRAGDGRMGLVVVQEIFGVNSHIRSVVERFADEGFAAVAPALFDRLGEGIELGYEAEDIAKGRELKGLSSSDNALKDVAAAVDLLAAEGRKVGVVGYCWGGSLAWAAATRLDRVAAAVGYYGGEIAKHRDETPKAPVMLHFGAEDHGIPLADVEAVKTAHPDIPVHVYEGAGHGFSCDARASFDETAHALALERTLAFLKKHLA